MNRIHSTKWNIGKHHQSHEYSDWQGAVTISRSCFFSSGSWHWRFHPEDHTLSQVMSGFAFYIIFILKMNVPLMCRVFHLLTAEGLMVCWCLIKTHTRTHWRSVRRLQNLYEQASNSCCFCICMATSIQQHHTFWQHLATTFCCWVVPSTRIHPMWNTRAWAKVGSFSDSHMMICGCSTSRHLDFWAS